MFEEEIKMEERSSNAGPMLLIGAVCLTILATAIYVIHEARKGMSEAEARQTINAMLEQRGPATVHFRTGLVTASATEKPGDLQYQLLERAQVITSEKRDRGTEISLTENGAKLLQSIAGTTHIRNSDGTEETEEYVVPLGTREVVAVTGVNVKSPSSATIHYTWKWRPTAMGDVFDLAGNYAGGFDVWERSSLAKDYGADLYHGAPISDEYNATRGWQMARN
jgi:hypothetical protein